MEGATLENSPPFCLPADVPICAQVLRVVDGDTLVCAIANPLGAGFCSIRVRLFGADTPELHPRGDAVTKALEAEAAAAAKARTARFVAAGGVTITPRGARTTFDAFGRVVADVDCGESLAACLVREGFARRCTAVTAGAAWDEAALRAVLAADAV